jgi:hypothetical protein
VGHRIAAQDVADPDRLDLQHLRRVLLANLARGGRLERFAVLEGPGTGVPDAGLIPGTRTTPGKEHWPSSSWQVNTHETTAPSALVPDRSG